MTIDATPRDSLCSSACPLLVKRIGESCCYSYQVVETRHRLRSGLDIDIGHGWLKGNVPGHCYPGGLCAFSGSYHVPLLYHALSCDSALLQAEVSCVADRGYRWRVSKIVGRCVKDTVRSHISI
jgi:hypothetical protein